MRGLTATFGTLSLLAIPAQAYAAPADSWTGPYGGVSGSVIGAHSDWSGTNVYTTNDGSEGEVTIDATVFHEDPIDYRSSKTAGAGGGRLGYNVQDGNVVLGLEGDVNFFSLTHVGTTSSGGGGEVGYETRTHASVLGTVRARLGLAMDRFMVFGTGGLAFSNLRHSFTTTNGFSDSKRAGTGWAAGGGAEAKLNDRFSIAATVLYIDMGTTDLSDGDDEDGFSVQTKSHFVVGSLGLNVHF